MSAQFLGGRELERNLLALSEKLAKRIGRKAVREAAKPILDHAKGAVAVDQGRVKRALRVKVDQKYDRASKSKMPVIEATVAVRGRGAFDRRKSANGKPQEGSAPAVVAAFLEDGTSDTPPQPFIRPAWDAEGGETAIERMGRVLGSEIEREATSTGSA